jgi:hypothetical protein
LRFQLAVYQRAVPIPYGSVPRFTRISIESTGRPPIDEDFLIIHGLSAILARGDSSADRPRPGTGFRADARMRGSGYRQGFIQGRSPAAGTGKRGR